MIPRIFNLLLFIPILNLSMYAQQALILAGYKAQGSISMAGKNTGFYKVPLSPEILSICKKNMSDIRIRDAKGNEVPYIVSENIPTEIKNATFAAFPILKKEYKPKKYTHIVFGNETKKGVQKFSIRVKNNSVYKAAALSGSDDMTQWYTVSTQYKIASDAAQDQSYGEYLLEAPSTDYRYYRLEIADSTEEPINVMSIGEYINTSRVQKEVIVIPDAQLSVLQNKKEKTTTLVGTYAADCVVDELSLSITAPALYNRRAVLYLMRSSVYKNKTTAYREEIAEIKLTSGKENIFRLNGFKEKIFYIEIKNEDSPSLEVVSIKGIQYARCIQTFLEADNKYTILMGNEAAEMPHYDIDYFAQNIPKEIATIDITGIEINKGKDIGNIISKKENNLWIWLAIVVVGILIAIMSVQMIRGMNKEQ